MIVHGPNSLSSYVDCINGLRGYETLPDDWDGYGGDVPKKEAIDDAINIVRICEEVKLPVPLGMVSALGEVGIYWRGNSAYCHLWFIGDGKFNCNGENKTGFHVGYEGLLISNGMPSALKDFINDVSK